MTSRKSKKTQSQKNEWDSQISAKIGAIANEWASEAPASIDAITIEYHGSDKSSIWADIKLHDQGRVVVTMDRSLTEGEATAMVTPNGELISIQPPTDAESLKMYHAKVNYNRFNLSPPDYDQLMAAVSKYAKVTGHTGVWRPTTAVTMPYKEKPKDPDKRSLYDRLGDIKETLGMSQNAIAIEQFIERNRDIPSLKSKDPSEKRLAVAFQAYCKNDSKAYNEKLVGRWIRMFPKEVGGCAYVTENSKQSLYDTIDKMVSERGLRAVWIQGGTIRLREVTSEVLSSAFNREYPKALCESGKIPFVILEDDKGRLYPWKPLLAIADFQDVYDRFLAFMVQITAIYLTPTQLKEHDWSLGIGASAQS